MKSGLFFFVGVQNISLLYDKMPASIKPYSYLQRKLSHYCGAISNPAKISILETIACKQSCSADIKEVGGLSRFTVGMNLKYLKKSGLVKGSLTSKNLSYCIDYEKLDEFKALFDEFYKTATSHRHKSSIEEKSCK